jgi:hypothetical protein
VNQSPHNPAGNKLGPGINEPNLIRAIETSGYPLQGVVADKLKSTFGVTEEWGYIDRDTQEHRSLDVFAFKKLLADGDVQPSLVLLIECKRSIHPYIFFKNVVDREIPRFPQIAGLTRNAITIHESSGKRLSETSGMAVLGLAELPFVRPGPPHCSAFTMAIAQGDKVTVSGTDPFNSVILPLVKAMDHATSLYKAEPNPTRLYPTLILGLSVLDAPILVVNSPREASTPVLMPWVRVRRQEAQPDRDRIKYMHYAVDLVHVDFFDEFIADHLTPFADEFVSRVKKQSTILFKSGTVELLDNWRWDKIKPYHT